MAMAIAFSAAACNNAASSESETGHMHSDAEMQEHHGDMEHAGHAEMASAETPETGISQEQAKELTQDYLELKNALVKSDAKAAKEAAEKMHASLENTKDDLGKEILKNIEQFIAADGLEAQRQHFVDLSQNMYQLASTVKTGQELYWQHCPMANAGKGANWISSEEEIANPYYGDRMLKCGRVEETIK